MKKTLLLILAIFLFAGFSYGQLTLGIRAGYNGNKLYTSLSNIESQFKSGFHVGVFSRFGKRLYFAPELIYTFSGGEFTNNGTDTSWNKQSFTIGSLDVPLLVGFKIIRTKLLKWRIELGPVASFIVHKKVTNFDDLTGPITNADFNSIQWQILAGTGIDLWFMTLDIRYQYAFNSLLKDVENYSFDTKNNYIVVSLGFKILGNK
ncbi:MAG TPA: porin family protein [Bacteroidales bacterium]|nr:porin family protein [Bacteroidales bacterium]